MNSRLYSTVILSKQQFSEPTNLNEESFDQQFRKISDKLYIKLTAQEITEDQMRIEFSKQVLTLILSKNIRNISTMEFSRHYFEKMDELIGQNISFLKTIYPKLKNSKTRHSFAQNFSDKDESDRVEFDFLVNMGIHFSTIKDSQLKESTDSKKADRSTILEQIQQLLNKIIITAQQSAPKFNNIIRSIIPSELSRKTRTIYNETIRDPRKFQLTSLLGDNANKLFNKELIHQNFGIDSFGLFQVLETWIGDLEIMINQPEEYLRNREFLKTTSNSKASQSVKISSVKSMKIFNKKSNISRSTLESKYSSWSDINLFGELPENQPEIRNPEQNKKEKQQSFLDFILNGFKDLCKETDNIEGFHQDIEQRKKKYTDKRSALLWGDNKAIKKKVENVSQDIEKIGQYRKKYQNLEFRNSGYPLTSYSDSMYQIGRENNYEVFAVRQIQNLQQYYSQNQKIVKKNGLRQKYTQEEKLIYSFAQNTYDFLQQMLIQKLVKLISIITEFQDQIKSGRNLQHLAILQDIELLSMRLKEMLNCSLVGDEQFIKEVYQAIINMHTDQQISIMKVENRLDTCHKDILIQFTICGSPITCSLKLLLEYKEAMVETKLVAAEMMYNFFENIENSSYGPLAYLSYVLASMDHRINYLSKIKKLTVDSKTPLARLCHCGKGIISQESPYYCFEKDIKEIIDEEGHINLMIYKDMLENGFVCGVCEKAIKKGSNILPVQKCADCNYTICVDCAFEIYREHQIKAYLMLLNSIARIIHPSWQAQLILQDSREMGYSHTYKKQGRKINIGVIEKKIQNYYNIIIEGRNIVKFEKNDKISQFWRRIRDKIQLKRLPCYENVIKGQKYAGVILRPRELLRQKGTPFLFIQYEAQSKKFYRFIKKLGDIETLVNQINELELQLEENDIFFPIVWLQGEEMIPEYIGKVLTTNPFCLKKQKETSFKRTFQRIKQIQSSQIDMYENRLLNSDSKMSLNSQSGKKQRVSRPRFSANRLAR